MKCFAQWNGITSLVYQRRSVSVKKESQYLIGTCNRHLTFIKLNWHKKETVIKHIKLSIKSISYIDQQRIKKRNSTINLRPKSTRSEPDHTCLSQEITAVALPQFSSVLRPENYNKEVGVSVQALPLSFIQTCARSASLKP